MKIKDYLETLPEDLNISGMKGLFGKELKILEPYFESIDELKGKKIEIIEELNMVGEPIMEMTNEGVSFKQEIEPKLLTIKGVDDLKENVKLYSIFLQNGDVIVRCSEDSIISKIEILINEIKSSKYYNGDLSDLGNDIGILVGKYLSDDLGFEEYDFISGIKHGISISNGTHV
jgi:hypothetical protein